VALLAQSSAVTADGVTGNQRPRMALTSEGTHHHALAGTDWITLLVPGLVWGASFLLIDESLDSFEPGVVTWVRIAVGCVVLGLFPAARRSIGHQDWARIVAVSVTWLAFPMTLFPIAQQHIASGLAGMLNGSIPLFVAVLATLSLRRAPGPAQRLGLAVGGVGIVLLGLPALGDGSSSAMGVALVVIACMSYGVAINLNVPLVQRYGTLAVFWRVQLVSVVLTTPFGLYGLRDSTWGWRSAGANVALGAFGTALAFVLLASLSARVGSTRASVITYLEAVAALVLGSAFNGEPVRALEVVGCAVLLSGAYLLTRADTGAVAAPSGDPPAAVPSPS
jgi:drug/metabolite transporter (DMT)-like permease